MSVSNEIVGDDGAFPLSSPQTKHESLASLVCTCELNVSKRSKSQLEQSNVFEKHSALIHKDFISFEGWMYHISSINLAVMNKLVIGQLSHFYWKSKDIPCVFEFIEELHPNNFIVALEPSRFLIFDEESNFVRVFENVFLLPVFKVYILGVILIMNRLILESLLFIDLVKIDDVLTLPTIFLDVSFVIS